MRIELLEEHAIHSIRVSLRRLTKDLESVLRSPIDYVADHQRTMMLIYISLLTAVGKICRRLKGRSEHITVDRQTLRKRRSINMNIIGSHRALSRLPIRV
jgi:hypothetical protein